MTTSKYLRLSSEDVDLRDGGKMESNSISNQRNLLDAFISRTPELAESHVIEFCDDGWSGKNFERPAVQEMLFQVKQGKIQCVIVKDFSRFGRDYLTVGNYISRVFPFLGVRFISVNDGFDSIRSREIDSLETSFQTILYDLYSRDLSRKIRKAKRFRAEQGKFLSPFAPYGYVKDPADKNHLVIDPPAAEVVRRIFKLTGSGQTAVQIAKTLNAEGVPTPMLYKRAAGCSRTIWPCIHEENFWTDKTIEKILRDERYIGKNIYGKMTHDVIGSHHMVAVGRKDWIIVENTHMGIVSEEEFNRVRPAMRACTEYKEYPVSTVRGKIRCGVCGRSLAKRKRKTDYYYCRTPSLTDAYHCAGVRIGVKEIDNLILEGLRAQASLAVELSRIWEERRSKVQQSAAATAKTLAALKEKHSQQEQHIKDLYEPFVMGEIGKAEYLAMKNAAIKERDALAAQIERTEASIENWGANGILQNRFVDSFKQYTAVQALTEEIISDVLDSVHVYPDGQIEIIWNFCDELKQLILDLQGEEQNGR